MSRSVLSRLVCGLLITIVSALPLAAAEPATQAAPRATGLSSLWSWLTELWSENGCYIDPYGGCYGSTSGTPSVQDHLDEGCYIDPYGGCRG